MAFFNIMIQAILCMIAAWISFFLLKHFINALITGFLHYTYFLFDALGYQGRTKEQRKRRELAYVTPWVTNIYIAMLIVTAGVCFAPKCHPVILMIFLFVLMIPFYVGMRRRYAANKEELRRIVALNLEFLELCKVPITFLSAVIGAVLTVTGLGLKGPSALIPQLISVYDENFVWALNLIKWNQYRSVLYHISRIPLLWLWGYVFSLPLQWFSYWILPLLCHSGADLEPYRQVRKILFGKRAQGMSSEVQEIPGQMKTRSDETKANSQK